MRQREIETNVLADLEGSLERHALGVLFGASGLVGGLALLVAVLLMVLATAISAQPNGVADAGPGAALLPGVAGPGMNPVSADLQHEVPPDQLTVMQEVATVSSCYLPWPVLAGVATVESNFGRNQGPSSAGAIGYGQFMPATWAAYGRGGNPSDFRAAIPAMDRYLCAMVAEFGVEHPPTDALKWALFYYNHARSVRYDPADGYVQKVLALAALYEGSNYFTGSGLAPGWVARAALNQYDCSNYRTIGDCRTWAAAACSAAALDWLLGAYGVHVGGIDDAVGLIGPGSGILTSVGLLDSTGTRLSSAEAGVGLQPRRAQLHSSNDLRAWLSQGPLMLDGHAWFGVGHWFVGIGSDAGGIFTRDSSGHDTRYLSWSRLYGDVGWSGWVVGVQTPEGEPAA